MACQGICDSSLSLKIALLTCLPVGLPVKWLSNPAGVVLNAVGREAVNDVRQQAAVAGCSLNTLCSGILQDDAASTPAILLCLKERDIYIDTYDNLLRRP